MTVPTIPRKYARSETMTPGFSRTIEICRERLSLGPETTLLDVPCGKGEALARLAPSRCCSIGVDRSPQLLEGALDKLNSRGVTSARILLADGGVLPFPNGRLDVCLSIGGPSCIGGHAIGSVLIEQARVLKRGGWLVVSDLLRDDSDPNPWIGPDHPDAAGWWNLLERAGFRVTFFEHFPVSAWEEYHQPMRELVAEARRDHGDDADELAWAEEVEREIEMDLPTGPWANYGTFVAQKDFTPQAVTLT